MTRRNGHEEKRFAAFSKIHQIKIFQVSTEFSLWGEAVNDGEPVDKSLFYWYFYEYERLKGLLGFGLKKAQVFILDSDKKHERTLLQGAKARKRRNMIGHKIEQT